jgi:hypothetical protein
MRFTLVPALLFVATACYGADETKATRKLEGVKTTFPAKIIKAGVKAAIAALETCHSSMESSDPAADMKRAQEGDHVRVVFAKPVKVEVLNDEYEISEVVFAPDPGVFWIRSGDKVLRCGKYQFQEMQQFQDWYRQTLPAD